MIDFSHLFVSAAFAQDAAAPAEGTSSALMNYLPFIAIFGVFYFMVIQPQQKKLAAHDKMVKALQRGDRVLFAGGVHGKVSKLDGDNILFVEIADGVEVKIDRTGVTALEAKPKPAGEGESK